MKINNKFFGDTDNIEIRIKADITKETLVLLKKEYPNANIVIEGSKEYKIKEEEKLFIKGCEINENAHSRRSRKNKTIL